jgi:transcriptional regulator with XRE-family HTH domain
MSVNGDTRYCGRCGTRLAADNRGRVCGPCQRALNTTARDAPPPVPPGFWQVDLMRDSLAGRHMGHVIRSWRLHPFHGPHAIPQSSVARWLSISQAQLSRLESGAPLKDLDRLAHSARVLGISVGLLWFHLDDEPAPGRDISLDTGMTQTPEPRPGGSDRGRRVTQALDVIGGSQLGDIADSLGELVDHYSAAVCALPPADVYEDILAVRSYANGVMDRAGNAPRRADLTTAAGWLSALLAIAACDMGEHAAARAWCSDAERHSQDARHPDIAGWAALTRSLVAYYQGQPRQSAALASRGQQLAPAGTAIRVKLAAQEMRAAAMTGDVGHMTRARRRAGRQMTLLPAFSGGLGAFSVPAGEDPPYTATSLLLVGRHSEAATATSRLIAAVYPPQSRAERPSGYARAQLILALAHAGLGALDEAAAAGQTALAGSPPVWPTRVLAGKLDQVLTRDFADARQAAAFHDQYLQAGAATAARPQPRPGLDR